MTASVSGAAGQHGLRIDLPTRRTDRWRAPVWPLRLPFGGNSGDPVGDVIRAHRRVHRGGDAKLVRRAYATAERMHRGQMRKSGEPYITHPVAVARILADLGMDTTTLVAALLHDTVEDTSYTLTALETDFGGEVALLVDGVTKLDKAFFGETAEVETIRKMLVKAGQDVRVLIIKIADRLHNMRTLDVRSPASRARIASATLDVLVPLSDRLGVQALKRSLEDSVLATLHPEAYATIEDHVNNRPDWNSTLDEAITLVRASLDEADIDAHVGPRPRHYYSIWRDTIAKNQPIDHELPRIAIVVEGGKTDCYTALGVLHTMWRPVPGRFKDFIASPKNNLYRSLHTSVIGPSGQVVEAMIRTAAMHHSAEFGIAAYFRGPHDGAKGDHRSANEQLTWLRRVVDWQQSVDDAQKFLDALRCDLTYRQLQVFTTAGESVALPGDATPVDLAYTLDAELGHACIGATINGRLAPLSSPLADGDVVEILRRGASQIGDHTGPAAEWLTFVKSPQARLEITRWFAEQSETDSEVETIAARTARGRAEVGHALREAGRWLANDGPLQELGAQLGYPDVDALHVAVADEKLEARDVVSQLIALVDRSHPTLP
jgi:guanosine-3',5'-bis(diphosphate) 3'-pyrophosphohydrolase